MSGLRGGEPVFGSGLASLTGRQIGRYLVGERLGSGGAATVYRAFDQVQGLTVALKVLLPSADEKSLSRFRREAMTAGALRHPNIVRILQVGTAPQGEVAYIAMELVEGESLADLLSRRPILPPHECCALLAPVARALAFAHAAGVIHRDVKPSNILLRPAGVGEANAVHLDSLGHPVIPLLSDFGIARSLDAPELTSAGRTVGTPAYMAPEQAAGSRTVDGRADVYALATVLYRCTTGRLPYAGSATQILHAHVYEPLLIDNRVLAWLPPELPLLLAHALAKRPEDRTQTPQQLAAELESIARKAPLPGEHDPFATATLESLALVENRPMPGGGQTTVLVPGAGASTATGTAVSPYAPQFAGMPAAGAAPPRTGAFPSAAGGGGMGAPPQGPLDDGDQGSARRWSPWLWVAAVVLFGLLGALTAAAITAMQRNDPGGIAARATFTPTPTATERAASSGTPATLVIVVPPEEQRTPLPTFAVPPTATPILLPPFVPPTATPVPATVTDTPTPVVVTATPTSSPTWTPTQAPIMRETNTPTPALEATPSPTATRAPATATPAPTQPAPSATSPAATVTQPAATATLPATQPPPAATHSATPTTAPNSTLVSPTPAETPTPGEPPCAFAVDPALEEFVVGLDPDSQPGFECPQGAGMSGAAVGLRFERGSMLDGGALGMLVLLNNGGWEQLLSDWEPGDPDPLPPEMEAPDGTWLPQDAFAAAWLFPGVQDALGYALEPEPEIAQIVAQQFAGGIVATNLNTGEVVALLGQNRGL